MQAFSIDLRERALAAYDANEGTQQQIADRFKVSVSWLRKVLRQRRQTGSIAPKPHGGGRTRVIDQQVAQRLRQAVAQTPDATLAELAQTADVQASPSMVHRALKALGVSRKKTRTARLP